MSSKEVCNRSTKPSCGNTRCVTSKVKVFVHYNSWCHSGLCLVNCVVVNIFAGVYTATSYRAFITFTYY